MGFSSKASSNLRVAGAHIESSEKELRFARPAKGIWGWSEGKT